MITGQIIATCMMMAAQTYTVPPAVLVGIMKVEGGKVGQAVANKNGTHDLGIMQINTIWVPELADKWKVSKPHAQKMIRDDPCINIHVAAWILRQRIDYTGNLTKGIAGYHSFTPRFGNPYALKVIAAMRRMDLIQD